MSMAQMFLGELEQENAATRRILERIPSDKLDWKPHEKSMTLGQLGLHIANNAGTVAQMASQNEVEMPDFSAGPASPASTDEILSAFDAANATANEVIGAITDEQMGEDWTAKMGEAPIMTMPKAGLLRGILLNHGYHHRGQLSVYLRMLDVSVPSVYGPSADELPDFLKEATAS